MKLGWLVLGLSVWAGACAPPENILITMAGTGQSGQDNGPALSATFDRVKAIAFDRNTKHLVIADFNNHKAPAAAGYNNLLRRLNSEGAVITLAGGQTGFADGNLETAQFHGPASLVFDSAGNLYIADFYNNRIRKLSAEGLVTTVAGTGEPGELDGPALTATLNQPSQLALAPNGDLYFAEEGNRKIRKLTPDGQVITLAGSGKAGDRDGPAAQAEFTDFGGLAVDLSGNLLISDAGSHKLRLLSPAGEVSTFAGTGKGYQDGPRLTAAFNKPAGIVVSAKGDIYLADYGNNRIRKISPSGVVTTAAGSNLFSCIDGPVSQATLNNPVGLAFDRKGNLFVADYNNNRVRKLALAP